MGFRIAGALFLLLLSTSLSAQRCPRPISFATTCGRPCGAPGCCPPTVPMGAGPGENHAGEDHSNANLSGANLRGANLVVVDFWQADLSRADLSGALMEAANVELAIFAGADLSNAQGLACTTGWAFFDCFTKFTGTGFDPRAAGWIQLGAAPAQIVRLGTPPNAPALQGPFTSPVLGFSWQPLLDNSIATASVLNVLIITAAPLNLPTPSGTLLCDVSGPTLLFGASPGTRFVVPLPIRCTLIGATLCSQGVALNADSSLTFYNALDITLGRS